MLSMRHQFVFTHVPKTAGSSLLEVLLPYSDASRVVGYGNGGQYWNLKDPIADSMHEPILTYKQALGDKFQFFSVLAGFRDPFERMLSLYFSPHRWRSYHIVGRVSLRMERHLFSSRTPISNGTLGRGLERVFPVQEHTPVWSEEAFSQLVCKAQTHSDLLRVDSESILERDRILPLRFRWIERDFANAVERLGLPGNLCVPMRATGLGQPQLMDSLGKSRDLRAFVESVHREDYEHFHEYF
jgi:hypothetical protein